MLSFRYQSLAWLTLLTSYASAGPFEIVGCYVMPTTGGIFGTAYSFADQPDVTYEKCISKCPTTSTLFAIADGYTCYCGSSVPATLTAAPVGDCRYLCSGDASQWCGGPSRVDIFRKNATYVAAPTTLVTVTSPKPGSTLNTIPPNGAPTAPTSGRTTAAPGQSTVIPTVPSGPTTAPPRTGQTTAPPTGRTTAPPGQTTAPPPQGQTTAPPPRGSGTTAVPDQPTSTRSRRTTTTARPTGSSGNDNGNNDFKTQQKEGAITNIIEGATRGTSAGSIVSGIMDGVNSIISGITGSIGWEPAST